MMTLVLAGVIISGLMNAILGLLKYLADPETQLASITHWQLGSPGDCSVAGCVHHGTTDFGCNHNSPADAVADQHPLSGRE